MNNSSCVKNNGTKCNAEVEEIEAENYQAQPQQSLNGSSSGSGGGASSLLPIPTPSPPLGVIDINKKRENYICWNDYFMAVAFLSAMRSKDPVTQVGACIVNKENKIVGIGYNGMPIGCSDDEFPWQKQSENPIENKFLYVCHAELNSILNKIVGELNGCRIFVAMFPCNECAKLIIQSGIREVIYVSNKNWGKVVCTASKRMFDAAGVIYTQYTPTLKKIVIDFEAIDWNKMSQLPTTPKKARKEYDNDQHDKSEDEDCSNQ